MSKELGLCDYAHENDYVEGCRLKQEPHEKTVVCRNWTQVVEVVRELGFCHYDHLNDFPRQPHPKTEFCKNWTSIAIETKEPVIDEIRTFGLLDRALSEMKYILDHPKEFDAATFQTMKHHIEDADLFVKYAKTRMETIKSLPPTAEQRPRGY